MIQKYTVVPKVPDRLRPLLEIARNLWWVWNRNAVALFRRIDVDLWEESHHNPIQLLGSLRHGRLLELGEDEAFLAHMDSVAADLKSHLEAQTWYHKAHGEASDAKIAYFSAEFGLHESLPMYSGGLGVLAGDHIKSSEELGLPLVGVSLSYHQGYNRQYLSSDGWQLEHYPDNDFSNMPMTMMRHDDGAELRVEVQIGRRNVSARVWKVQVGRVSTFFLDSNVPDNAPEDREVTQRLYGGDLEMRVRQEILLGIGGYRALRLLGYSPTVCHMNEGHSAFLALERIRLLMEESSLTFSEAREAVAAGTVFTTHTPVPAGNDRFPPDLILEYFRDYIPLLQLSVDEFLSLGREDPSDTSEHFCMTVLALRLSSGVNGVSELHGRISRTMWRRMWPAVPEQEIPILHVTNGVHTHSWLSDEFARLFERYLGPRWLDDPVNRGVWLRVAEIPDNELWRAKGHLRARLVNFVRNRLKKQMKRVGASHAKITASEEALDPDILTVGFARRFATYKRANLILRDTERFRSILLDKDRPVQLIFAGKAHPQDQPGKELIRQIVQLEKSEEFQSRVVFIEDYDIDVARYLVQGVDVWLNTPRRPLEASGTSGMKSSMNGGLNLSILDGWWCEAYNGENGWAIGSGEEFADRDYQDWVESEMLYDLLEKEVIPMFYDRGADDVPREWLERVKSSVSTCGPQFNTNRMVKDYTERMYEPAAIHWDSLRDGDFRLARELASWKCKVREHWSDVRIVSVNADTSRELEVGSDLDLEVSLELGRLSGDEVRVEVVFGPLDSKEELRDVDATALQLRSESGDLTVFSGLVPCQRAGQHGFAVRVLPFRHELSGKFDAGVITWWGVDSDASDGHVAQKVGAITAFSS